MAFDGTLKFDTSIDQSGFTSGIGNLGSIAQRGMSLISGAVTAAAGKITELGQKAVSVGSSFESSMAQVIATMGITKDTVQDGVNSYDLLKDAAAAAGESTTFSASEAADALNYLALAGYSAAQSAEALPAVLDLAAAGGLDLAYASDLATDAMAALGIEANKDNLTHFGDQLAKTASKANASVSQLGEAILVVGGTAKSLAGGTTELNAALGVLANRGIKGAEGGTALRNMILSLSAPTDKAAAQLHSLGVEVLDAAGNMRPMNEIFRDMNTALADVSDGEKTQILNNIFNKVDLKSAQAMLAGCGKEFDDLTAALSDCDGAMSQMAETMNDTLEGDMKSLASKAEALGIAVYDSMNEPLRGLAQLGGEYLSKLTLAFKVGGVAGAARELGVIVGDVVKKLASYLPEIIRIGTTFIKSLAQSMKDHAPAILDALVTAAGTLIGGITEIAPILWDLGMEIITEIAESLTENLPQISEKAGEIIGQIGQTLSEDLPVIIEAAYDIITALVNALTQNIGMVITAAVQIITSLVTALLNPGSITKLLAAGVELLKAVAKAIVDNLPLLIQTAISLVTALCTDLLKPQNILALIEAAIDILLTLTDGIIDNLDEILIACEMIITTIIEETLKPENLGKLLELGVSMLLKLIEGLCQVGGKLVGFAWDLFTELASTLANIDWAQLGIQIVEGICSGLLDCEFVLDDFLGDFGDNWVSGIRDVFGIHSPSKVMREQVGRYLAEGVGEGFEAYMPSVSRSVTDLLHAPDSGIMPSATGGIVSSYYYSSTQTGSPNIDVHVHVSADLDGEKIADKIAERVDILQGEAVTFDERGTAH